jgi:hypothetical protein
MERNTKILLGLAAAGVVAYLILKKPPVNQIGTPAPVPKPAPAPAPKSQTNADVLFPTPDNFSWKDYFFGIKPIWSRL